MLANRFIRQYELLPYVVFGIMVLIVILFVMLSVKVLRVKYTRRTGVSWKLKNIKAYRRQDIAKIRLDKFIDLSMHVVRKIGLNIASRELDYYEYLVKRADIRLLSKTRRLTAEEYNSMIKFIAIIITSILAVLFLFMNIFLGIVICSAMIISTEIAPMLVVKSIVSKRDAEIEDHFVDMYMMIHHVLITGGEAKLESILRSYAETTSSEEMIRFVDVCCHHIETVGEYSATNYISQEYREVQSIRKLMRLIRQNNEGGGIKTELIGFRSEVIDERKYAIAKRTEKVINRAKFSFNILWIILVQALLSAIAVYMDDLAGISSLF